MRKCYIVLFYVLVLISSLQIHKCLWEILKAIQDECPSITAASHSLDMTSVADLMDGRLVHTLFSLALGLEGIKGFK